jgi:hypothetical protein
VSCRGSVADGLYRIHWVCGRPLELEPDHLFDTNDYAEARRREYRVCEMVSCSVHPLGYEFPNVPDPFPYRPELLFKIWRVIDETIRSESRAESVLARLEEGG